MTINLKVFGLAAAVAALSAGSAFAEVATTSLNVRSGPGIGYSVIATLAPGEYVSVRAESNGWCKIGGGGPNGWASCAYLSGGPSVTVRPDYDYGYGPDIALEPDISIGPSFPVFPFHHFNHPYPHFKHSHGMNDWWWLHHHN